MPQGRKELRDKFMVGKSDGISECEDMILAAGGRVFEGLIRLDADDHPENDELWDAVEYLVTEWDYACVDETTINQHIRRQRMKLKPQLDADEMRGV
jgi:hypothetical protein